VKDIEKVGSQKMFSKNVIKADATEATLGLEVTEEEAQEFKIKLKHAIRFLLGAVKVAEDTSTAATLPETSAAALHPAASVAEVPAAGTSHKDKGKHQIQQDLILNQLKTLFPPNVVLPDTLCICEFGCGKGGLAARVMEEQTAWGAKFLLVDREPRRNKRENKFKEELEIIRLRMDLCDLDLSLINTQNVFSTEIKEIVIITKHLCGVATDLALLSAQRSGLKAKLCMATCCHHACDWRFFVGRPIFEQLRLANSEEEFAKIRSITGWATSGRANAEKITIGRLAKTAIDLARCLWVAENLDVQKVEFVEYVGTDVTVENKLILAD
jgi:tRNA:m4X modification enzyme